MSDTTENLISSLISNGKQLANLLTDAKKSPSSELHNIAAKLIPTILKQLQNIHNIQLPVFSDEIVSKMLEKVGSTLQNLIKLDPEYAPVYGELVKRTNECKPQEKDKVAGQSSSSAHVPQHYAESSTRGSTPTEASVSKEELVTEFLQLSNIEQMCLFYCRYFSLHARAVKKREYIYLWVGMGLISDSLEGMEMLEKLVHCRFIKCNNVKNKMFDLMNGDVSLIISKEMNPSFIVYDRPHLSSIDLKFRSMEEIFNDNQKLEDYIKLKGTLVINKYVNTVEYTGFTKANWSDVKVLHLGNWCNDTEAYILADAEALKGLIRKLEKVVLLSLQGISGIVELPDAIYKLVYLKVLDLSGCLDLEFLPEGIESLTKLTHLDLSECYLLDHFPKGVALLTELRMLKGFIINPDEDSTIANGNSMGRRNTSSDASFRDLKALDKLTKLSIRTRRGDFPSGDDFDTLCAMKNLANLRIAWLCNFNDVSSVTSGSERFPGSLKKLELQATPVNTLPRLLKLISDDKQNSLQKLYIRGGRFRNLKMDMDCFPHVHTIRLRYLHDLHVDQVQLTQIDPNRTKVEIFDCPKYWYGM